MTNIRLIIVCFLFMYNLLCLSTVMASNNETLLVDINWLEGTKNDQSIVIIDARSYDEYMKGHIPKSINIPVSATFNPEKNKDRVANSAHIKTLFSNAGLEYNDTVVIYDSGNHIDAGRLFWVFEVFGHTKVKLLNGGYPAWVTQPNPMISKEIPTIVKTNYIPRLEPQRLTTKLSMHLAITDNNRIIIDARSNEEYIGKKTIASRAGHIPSSINIPWDKNFINKNGIKVIRPLSELKQLYAQIDSNKKIYLYCNKGKQSSLSYMLMRQLGFDAAHYDGSWYEWGNDDLLPIE